MVILRQGPPLPQAHQYVCQHWSAVSQSKNSHADTRGRTQSTQISTGPRLCLLPNVGNPRRTINLWPAVCQPHRTICIANLANHRSPRLFSDALPVTRCFA